MGLKAFPFRKERPRPLKAVSHCALVPGGTTRQSFWCSLKILRGLRASERNLCNQRLPAHWLPSWDRRVDLQPSRAPLKSFFCRSTSDCFDSGSFASKGANWPRCKSCRRFPVKTQCRAIDVMRDHAQTILSAACIWKG